MNDNLKECIYNTIRLFFNSVRESEGAPPELKSSAECRSWREIPKRRDTTTYALWALQQPHFVLRGHVRCVLTSNFTDAVRVVRKELQTAQAAWDYFA